IPTGLNVTFVIYGHEVFSSADDPRNCQAVKVARPLGKLDDAGKAELTDLVAGLKPTGGTPIALSLKVTGEELAKDKDAFCGIVLITDGLESCKGNPNEEVATLLKTLKLSFGVNLVGLGVKEAEDAALKTLAEAGGGKYYDADDADALADSISAIAKELEVKAKPVEVVNTTRRSLKFLQPTIEMPEMKEIVLIEADGPVKDATLFKKGGITKYGEEIRVPSSTAKYDVVWYPKSGEAIRIMKGVQLTERKVVDVKVEDLVGLIKVNGEGAPEIIHAGAVDDPGDLSFSTQRAKKFGEVMVVPVGSYDVFVDRSVIEEGLKVEPGKLYELE
ncbi:MAG TPA: VWA domain-containing protein, partial [Pirellulaceae bacterium]|nr:VWA domain-containing protein [Pirellulaceae bacterium]